MTPTSALDAALLAIYSFLSLPVIFVIFKHGVRHGAVFGWGFLLVFCTLKLISSGMQLNDPASIGASILGSVGLSPLLFSALGILHEARAYCVANRDSKMETVWVLFVHIIISAGIALAAVGASNLSDATSTPDEITKGWNLARGGYAILLVSWLAIVAIAFMTFVRLPVHATPELPDEMGGKLLLAAVCIAIPFIGTRLIAALTFFATENFSINPTTGSIGFRGGALYIEEILVVVCLASFGIVTKNIGKRATRVNIDAKGFGGATA